MFEVVLIDTIDNWYKRIATFGTRDSALSFLKKVGLNLILDYSDERPLVGIRVREIEWERI